MKISKLLYIFLSCIVLSQGLASAQPTLIVQGKITDQSGGPLEGVEIYGYSNFARAQDAYQSINDFLNNYISEPELGISANSAKTNAAGEYSINILTDGYLVFFNPYSTKLVKVNGQEIINVSLLGPQLDAAKVTADLSGVGADTEAELEGNNWVIKHNITLPASWGKNNARLIFQPFVLAADEKDTLEYRKPLVYDGKDFHITQERMLGFDRSTDPLFEYVVDTLTSDKMSITWVDTLFIPPAEISVVRHAKSITTLEDYNTIYYMQEDKISSTDKIRRPLRFLKYEPKNSYKLDADKYFESPRIERMSGSANISIHFLTGQAVIDPDDTTGIKSLDNLKNTLYNIIHGEGSQLEGIAIEATASPDGTYAKNVDLAHRRMLYAYNEIVSVIPNNYRQYLNYQNKESRVATWEEVAQVLDADSLTVEAAEVRAIIEKYPNNPDAQFSHIRNLSFYRPTIVDRFDKLRSMTCFYESFVQRAFTPEEIYNNYFDKSKGYYDGSQQLTLNEMWHLLNMVDDEDEIEHLYKLTYEQSRRILGRPWELAASRLAEYYLEKEIVDTTILSPFIDYNIDRCDYNEQVRDVFGNISKVVTRNPHEIVANQLIMHLRAQDFKSASKLAKMLPDTEEFTEMKAFTRVLGGYYKGGKTPEEAAERRHNFEIVRDSSPHNNIVMNLACNYIDLAEIGLQALEPTDPMTCYFRVVIESKKLTGKYFTDIALEQEMISLLEYALNTDNSLIEVAASDPDVNESILEIAMENVQK